MQKIRFNASTVAEEGSGKRVPEEQLLEMTMISFSC